MFLRGYPLANLRHDALAGLVVGLVAITLSIPFAVASGVGPAAGLVTVVVAGGMAALFGGSRVLVTGPTGGFIVVLVGVLQRHGYAGLLATTMLAGAILVLAGLLRLGQVVKFIPYPVLVGFTAGLALVIFLGQVPDLLGVHLGTNAVSASPLAKAWMSLEAARSGAWQPWSLATAAATVAIALLGGRFLPRVPNLVIGLVAGTVLVHLLHVPTPLLGDRFQVPHGLPAPHLPAWDWSHVGEILPDAITVAFLGALQSLLAAVVADGMTHTRHDSDQELIGQGLANLAAPLFGGIAAAGAVARTATGIQNGARTPVAAVVHVLVVLAVLLVLSPAVAWIPVAVLVGVLAVVCWNMSQRQHLRRLRRMPRQDAGVLLLTLGLTVAVGVNVAIAVGMVLAVGLFLNRLADATRIVPHALLGDAEAPLTYRPEDVPADVVVYTIQGALFFGATDQFRDAIRRVGKKPRAVIFRMRDVPYLDSTALNVLLTAAEELRRGGTRIFLTGIRSQPLQALEEAEAVHVLGEENIVRTTADALAALGVVASPAPQPSS